MSPLACSLLALAALLATAHAGDAETMFGVTSPNAYRSDPQNVPPLGGTARVVNVCGKHPQGVRVHATNGPNDHWPDITSANDDHTEALVTCTPDPPYTCASLINVVFTLYC